ncbi:hypothetical protein DC74_7488 [Streptomyces noursei]|nr:hypothetical protein DC74_7488 [Streptomyces noursei]
MHQNDRLQAPDTTAFERTVDQALNSPEVRSALSRTAGALNAEQLRSAAFDARDALAAAAAAEHRELVRLRGAAADGTRAVPPPPAVGTTSRSGGVLPALGVLVPGLAATAAAVFLLFGFGLHTVAAPSRLADELIAAGWTSAGVAVVATLTGLVWLLVAASRNRAAAEARTPDETDPAVVRAHEAWQLALLERAITPFLLGRIDRATGDGRPGGRPALPARPRPGCPAAASPVRRRPTAPATAHRTSPAPTSAARTSAVRASRGRPHPGRPDPCRRACLRHARRPAVHPRAPARRQAGNGTGDARAGSHRCAAMAGIRSSNVRPWAGVPIAAISQPPPDRKTLAMIWAVCEPPPERE